jgi:hypothetical protein
MKYILLWAVMNIHTGDILNGPNPVHPMHVYTAGECAEVLISRGVQYPDKDGDVTIFACAKETDDPKVQLTEEL